jgi:hypothetical protein
MVDKTNFIGASRRRPALASAGFNIRCCSASAGSILRRATMAKIAKNAVENSSNETEANQDPAAQGEPETSKVDKVDGAKIEPVESVETTAQISAETSEQLDAEEEEFKKLRCDLPGVKGTSASGIVAISVGKAPTKNEFFRSHPTFRPTVQLVDHEVGMEKQYFAVTAEMVEALASIGISVSKHTLYLTVTTRGAYRIVPVRQAINDDGDQNEYHRTKEIGLMQGVEEWVRLYTDQENHCYKVYPAPAGRYGEPQFPDLAHSKIFKLAFRDKGRLIDSHEHPLFKKWAARDSD